ncbi:Cleft lip and palate transmembrane protein 1-like protein [Liparis tanakae]|uniref:Cleft lip and palate transmembrane protein 1-like protein n=1 Tax=Liparis tanakae TaxID=230148 RepID=A0A4Z2IPW5_9TELE|nr:Cleft lip and palate transmembrane protein 1-like protein [Liparis tanakae]
MFPWCQSKPADGTGNRSAVAKLLLGVFVVYMLHTGWLLFGFINTKPCDGSTGELCITSYLTARARLQVSTGPRLSLRNTGRKYGHIQYAQTPLHGPGVLVRLC